MEQVVAKLTDDPRVDIFLLGGGPDEQATLARWAQKYPRVTSLAGQRHGFPVELALLSHTDVMVSMDSANMHLASLVNTPVVSIWGATHTYCGFRGWRQSETDIIQLPMTCRPCSVFGDKPCHRGDYHCLRGISPATILDHINAHIR
jgi:ADP-heptose:LPS heptosyltransferase